MSAIRKVSDEISNGSVAVSVIIPVLNGEKWITGQLEALARQELGDPWEVIVSDNGSTDGTADLVRGVARNYPVPIRVVDSSAKPGIAYARNNGVRRAVGKIVAFCDCDDIVGEKWLSALRVGLLEFDVVTGPLQILGQEEKTMPARSSFGTIVQGGNFATYRGFYLDLGGIDETLPGYGGEDIELSIRIADAKLGVGILEEMVMMFRPTPPGLRLLRKIFLSGMAEVEVWRRHPERYGDNLGIAKAFKRLFVTPFDIWKVRPVTRAARVAVGRVAHLYAQFRRSTVGPGAKI